MFRSSLVKAFSIVIHPPLIVRVQGSVLGPEEFLEGLGIGLRSFFGAGVVGK